MVTSGRACLSVDGKGGGQGDVDGGAAEDAEHSVAIQLIGLPGVLHVTSHLTMKKLKVDG